jgi:hypothetical protein
VGVGGYPFSHQNHAVGFGFVEKKTLKFLVTWFIQYSSSKFQNFAIINQWYMNHAIGMIHIPLQNVTRALLIIPTFTLVRPPELQNAEIKERFSRQRIEVNSAYKWTSDKRIEILRKFGLPQKYTYTDILKKVRSK